MDAAANQEVFFADNAAANVISGVQRCHEVGFQQHLQTVGCVLLCDGESSVGQFPGQITHHAGIVLLVEGALQAGGVHDQFLYKTLIVIKLIQCGGVLFRGVPFQFGEEKVDEVMDGGIEHDNIVDVSPVAGHLQLVVPPLVLTATIYDEKKRRRPALLFLLPVHLQPPIVGALLLIHFLVGEKGVALRVLLGFVEKPIIFFQQDLKHPISHQLTAQFD